MKVYREGMALIEIMIIVILISTVATAYWNYYITRDIPSIMETAYSPADSIADEILDEIAMNLRLARFDSSQGRNPVVIIHEEGSDHIDILSRNTRFAYYLDDNSLIREIGNQKGVLLNDVISLKATPMGVQTVVLTMKVGMVEFESGKAGNEYQSYSRVVSLNSPIMQSLMAASN